MVSSGNIPSGTYPADPADDHEIARLLMQGNAFTIELGDLLPSTLWSGFSEVLDVGCGPGEWAVRMAVEQLGVRVTGIDIEPKMINYATMLAKAEGVASRTRFLTMDATGPLAFKDATFDLVNARMCSLYIHIHQWPSVIGEYYRIARPGGVVLLTEFEMILSNSYAQEKLNELFNRATFQAGMSFSPYGRSQGITPMIRKFLVEGGFRPVTIRGGALDCSYGAPFYDTWRDNFIALTETFTPFIIRQQIISQEEITRLHEQALDEMSQKSFNGVGFCLAVWGVKPVSQEAPDRPLDGREASEQ